MANPICYAELTTDDPQKAKSFYEGLFRWKFQTIPMQHGDYHMIMDNDGPGRGIMKTPIPGMPPAWTSYVAVDNIKEMTEKAANLGAKVLMDVTPVEGHGFFSILQDPTGAVIALWMCLKK